MLAADHLLAVAGKMKLIPLNKGKYFTQVSDRDFKWLSQWTWYKHHGYAVRNARPQVGMHTLIRNGERVDHKNRDKLDNTRRNLRPATQQQNSRNRSKFSCNTSGYKGVSVFRLNFWTAHIGHSGHLYHLGVFPSAIEAAKAYDKAARKYHGKFASLNFEKRKHEKSRARKTIR